LQHPARLAPLGTSQEQAGMAGYKLTREGLHRCGFFETALAQRLAADPVGLVDVGARWGVSPEFAVAAPLFSALAFEPDPEEARRVLDKGRSEDWAGFAVEAKALGRDARSLALNLYSRANNSSVHPVSPKAKVRYALGGFELDRVLSVPANSLDAVVFGDASTRTGEVVKLDTQGAELDILAGAARTLRERTVCIVTEAHFFRLYDGAPFFAEIDRHLRGLGFTFIGFSDFQNRSSKRLDKRTHWGRERVFQADAIYFRDPLDATETVTPRAVEVAVLMAILLGYFDMALEWAAFGEGLGLPAADLSGAIDRIAAVNPAEPRAEAAALFAAIERAPEFGHVLIGKFVDRYRDLATFHDIPLPPPEQS
jgi:FkbM family methyltransferase